VLRDLTTVLDEMPPDPNVADDEACGARNLVLEPQAIPSEPRTIFQ
jgi:hypothetical protein